MANVCSWCGECAEEDLDSPVDMVCRTCWEKVQQAKGDQEIRPWKAWSAARDYKYEPMKRTDRF